MKPAPTDPPEIRRLLWDWVPRGYCGWDAGANCGQTLPEMISRFQTVLAFEPAAECRPHLEAWATDMPQVAIFNTALSDHNGPLQLAALPGKITTGQLVSTEVTGMTDWGPTDSPTMRTVSGRSIDSLVFEDSLERPDFIKLDVEGHEWKVIRGARQSIRQYRPHWLVEFHSPQLHEECKNLLHEFGYELSTVRHPHYPAGSDMWFQHGWLTAYYRD